MTPKEIDLVQRAFQRSLRSGMVHQLASMSCTLTRGPAPRPLFAGADAGRQVTLLITAVANAVGAVRPGDRDRVEPRSANITPAAERTTHHFRSAGAALVDVCAPAGTVSSPREQADAWTSACNWWARMVLAPRHSFAA